MWKLMHDGAISHSDRTKMCEFLMSDARLTYGAKVKEFENKWSKWLGVKHSVFVNSGSSANLILVQAAHDLYGHGSWAAQSCTWSTNIAPIIQLQKKGGIFLTDIDLKNLGPSIEDVSNYIKLHDIKYIFLTHVLGLSALSEELIKLCSENGVIIFEDCCESHGTVWNGNKIGTVGKASTFSFFYGHHMTTIEGGMICTNDDEFYERLLLLRSHGLLRELPEEKREKYKQEGVDQRFTFLCSGYNVRNTDLQAVLGIEQMDRLEKSIHIRNKNFKTFVDSIDREKYYSDFVTDGTSLFAFPIICKKVEPSEVRKALDENCIENRPLIAGNLLKHPMLEKADTFIFPMPDACKNANFIHNNSFYVGNNETINEQDVRKLTSILNAL